MTAASAADPQPLLTIDYVREDLQKLLDDESTLAIIGFGDAAPEHLDPRYLRVGLEPLGTAPYECWRGRAPVARGTSPDGIGWSEDGSLQFGALALDELAHQGEAPDERDDIGATTADAYQRLIAFTTARGYPHVLRVWNYLDGITTGEGDDERYRRFCLGRANGLRAGLGADPLVLPAATAIGRIGSPRRLQLYWLASRTPGTALENPRQLSAYRYPRQYGPQPPSFARAMLPPDGSAVPLLLSGTAAIVGHQSHHPDSVATQLDETLTNLGCMIAAARARRPSLPARFGPRSRLKVYVRERDEMPIVAALLDERLGPDVPRIVLHAQVCRRELRVEIDGSHA